MQFISVRTQELLRLIFVGKIKNHLRIFESKYSRIDLVKFVKETSGFMFSGGIERTCGIKLVDLKGRCIWFKVFKKGPSNICGRQPLKNLK